MQTTLSPNEVATRGRNLYARTLKEKVESEHREEFLMLDIISGDHEISPDDITAEERLLSRRPDAIIYQIRIGADAAYFLGGVGS